MGLHEQRAVALRGDPGLLGALGGAVKGFFSGGPVGAVAGAIGGFKGKASTQPPPYDVSRLPPPGYSGIPKPGGGYVPLTKIPGVTGALQRALPGGMSGYGVPVGATGAPQGYHLNKTGYWTAAGYVPPRSKWVKNRTRNVSNGKANQRALRRLVAWDKADRKRRAALKRIAR